MLPVHVVEVVVVGHCSVTAIRLMDVHMGAMGEVLLAQRLIAAGPLLDMVIARSVDLSIVEEVEVIIVWHMCVATPAIVLMGMAFDGGMSGVGAGSPWRSVIHAQDGNREWPRSGSRTKAWRH